jgi:inosine/xanthosine triphosphatase
MKIIICSKNPVKRNATVLGFQSLFSNEDFEVQEVNISSGVSAQPMTEEETLQGARQRVEKALNKYPGNDYYVGIEGGVEIKNNEMECFAWVYIRGNGKVGKGRTGTFILPYKIAELVKQGKELGEADDIVFEQINSKQKMGTIGVLTRNIIDRTEFYKPAVILALVPFINEDLY